MASFPNLSFAASRNGSHESIGAGNASAGQEKNEHAEGAAPLEEEKKLDMVPRTDEA